MSSKLVCLNKQAIKTKYNILSFEKNIYRYYSISKVLPGRGLGLLHSIEDQKLSI
jgi:hypothetical protein